MIKFNEDKTKILIEIPCKGDVIEEDINGYYLGVSSKQEIKNMIIEIVENELTEFLNLLVINRKN